MGKSLKLVGNGECSFYLVTRNLYTESPSYINLWNACHDLRKNVLRMGIQKLAAPRLESHASGLNWRIVRNMMEVIFNGTGVKILIFTGRKLGPVEKTIPCYFFKSTGHCRAGFNCPFKHQKPNMFRDETFLGRRQCNDEIWEEERWYDAE